MNEICKRFGIKYPIIQAGMVWVSGAKLAAASANAGILGLIGAGSMTPELLDSHIQIAHSLTNKPFGVNLPLLYKDIEKQIEICLKNKVKIFFTSAGSPKKFTKYLKEHGAIVIHVTSSPELALKCQDAGVDMVVVEGFEAGGHNGREETTSMVLIPAVKKKIQIPIIAAGGIACGRSMAAALSLGAQGVQIGSRFVCASESSAHLNFKQAIEKSKLGDTSLTLKELVPVRLLKNHFYQDIQKVYTDALEKNMSAQDLKQQLSQLLGKGRAKKGMLEGDLIQGELEIGQVCGLIEKTQPIDLIVKEIISDFKKASDDLSKLAKVIT